MIEEIDSKLEQLGEYVGILREFQLYSLEEIRNNHILRGASDIWKFLWPACLTSAR